MEVNKNPSRSIKYHNRATLSIYTFVIQRCCWASKLSLPSTEHQHSSSCHTLQLFYSNVLPDRWSFRLLTRIQQYSSEDLRSLRLISPSSPSTFITFSILAPYLISIPVNFWIIYHKRLSVLQTSKLQKLIFYNYTGYSSIHKTLQFLFLSEFRSYRVQCIQGRLGRLRFMAVASPSYLNNKGVASLKTSWLIYSSFTAPRTRIWLFRINRRGTYGWRL